MSINQSIKCDICGVERKESNHWFRIAVIQRRFQCKTLSLSDAPWKDEQIACGPAHAQTFYGRYLSSGTLLMERHPEPDAKPVGLTEDQLLGVGER